MWIKLQYMTFPMIEIVVYVCETLAIVVQLGWLVLFLNITYKVNCCHAVDAT